MTTNGALIWNLSSYFPSFDGPEYRAHRDGLEQELRDLADSTAGMCALTAEGLGSWRNYILTLEKCTRDYSHLSSYISCLCSADTTNEAYRREQARLSSLGALYKKAFVPLQAALRDPGAETFASLTSDPALSSARYFIERTHVEARYRMSPEMEILAADLGVDGLSAWDRLYSTISGKLEFDLRREDGTTERIPMAQKGSYLEDPDPAVRKAVLEGSNAAWEQVEDAVAACLNGIAGTRLTLNRHRGVEHFLDVAAFQSAVSRETIDTMWQVIAERREIPRRYLRLKARALGRERLGFQDLAAPLPLKGKDEKYDWKSGTELLLGAFDSAYPALGNFTRDMLASERVEAAKRKGKRPGAFCTTSFKSGESRVYMTYGGSLGDLQTLAHELGHAWHGQLLADMRPFARMYPMTLAETASTFAEDLLANALLASDRLDASQKARVLDERLGHGATFLLNIHMRYLFEERFHVERQQGEVPVSRLKQLVLEAQSECYGDALAADELDPMFWASKLHFYIGGLTFYNFPYTFGYLLSRGLSTLFRQHGADFLPQYERFLLLTGSDTAEGVARRTLGIDLTRPDFWIQAVESLEEEIDQFEAIVSSREQ
ncbi:MAG: oligoendopeptidase [Candidatus Sumerlaeota bacterium]|nr:oligoendopeptidase [Candidatus Sumerlaeota bacterium]